MTAGHGPVILICDGCEHLFPEEKLSATDDGRALLCRGCLDAAEESAS